MSGTGNLLGPQLDPACVVSPGLSVPFLHMVHGEVEKTPRASLEESATTSLSLWHPRKAAQQPCLGSFRPSLERPTQRSIYRVMRRNFPGTWRMKMLRFIPSVVQVLWRCPGIRLTQLSGNGLILLELRNRTGPCRMQMPPIAC